MTQSRRRPWDTLICGRLLAIVACLLVASGSHPRAFGSFALQLIGPSTLDWVGFQQQHVLVQVSVTNLSTAPDEYVLGTATFNGAVSSVFIDGREPGLVVAAGATGVQDVDVDNLRPDPFVSGSTEGPETFTITMVSMTTSDMQSVQVTVNRSFGTPVAAAAYAGVVLDQQTGLPIVGAVLTLADPDFTLGAKYLTYNPHAPGGNFWQSPAQTAVTNAAGAFSVPAPPGSYRMVVDATGYRSALQAVTVPASGVTVALAPGPTRPGSQQPVRTVNLGNSSFRAGASADLSLYAAVPGFPLQPGHEFNQSPGDVTALSGSGDVLWHNTLPPETSGPLTDYAATDVDPVATVASDGSKVAVATNDGTFQVFDRSGNLLWSAKRSSDVNPKVPGPFGQGTLWATAVRFSPDSTLLAGGTITGWTYLFDATTGALRWQRAGDAQVRAIAFSPDGQRVYSGYADELAAITTSSGTDLWSAPLRRWPNHRIAVSRDGSRIASPGKNGILSVFDSNGVLLWQKSTWIQYDNAAFSPDGTQLVVASGGGVFNYDTNTGTLRWFRPGTLSTGGSDGFATSNGDVFVVNATSGNPNLIEVVDLDGTLLWSYATPSSMAVGTGSSMFSAHMLPDGSKLIGSGNFYNTGNAFPGEVMVFQDLLVPSGQTLPAVSLDTPSNNATVGQTFTVSGWAVDRAAFTGSGVDAVQVYAFPKNADGTFGSAMFLGVAAYGSARGDIGAVFGSHFTYCGFSLATPSLAVGQYRVIAYAHSAVANAFNGQQPVDITVSGPVSKPFMSLDGPANNSTIRQPFNTGGWAVDLGATNGVGVDAIHVWAFPVVNGTIGAGQFVDAALLGGARPDVAAVFGPQFAKAGFNFLMTGLSPGQYYVGVYVHSGVTGTFNEQQFALVTIVQ